MGRRKDMRRGKGRREEEWVEKGEEGGGRIGGARTRLGRRKSRLSHILS